MRKYNKVAKHNTLMEKLRSELENMDHGHRLPSVREMLKMYRVGRSSLDAALNELAAEGSITRVPNVGTFCRNENRKRKKVVTLVTPGPHSEGTHPMYHALSAAVEADRRFRFRLAVLEEPYYDRLNDELGDVLLLRIPSAELSMQQLQKVKNLSVPAVFIGHFFYNFGLHFSDTKPGFGGILAADCLLSHGHRKLAVLVSEPYVAEIKSRVDEFCFYARRKGAEVEVIDSHMHSCESCQRCAYDTLSEYLRLGNCPFTGLFVVSDVSAMGALRALAEYGVRVPDDVSVIGYDGLPQGEYYTPPLTTVSEDFALQAEKLVQAIGDYFDQRIRMIRVEVPPKLLLRQSVKMINQGE